MTIDPKNVRVSNDQYMVTGVVDPKDQAARAMLAALKALVAWTNETDVYNTEGLAALDHAQNAITTAEAAGITPED